MPSSGSSTGTPCGSASAGGPSASGSSAWTPRSRSSPARRSSATPGRPRAGCRAWSRARACDWSETLPRPTATSTAGCFATWTWADGSSVARLLIAGGFGRELTFAGVYAEQAANRAAEATAKTARAGLWGACPAFGSPVALVPAVGPKPAPSSPAACLIKGNVSSSGEKIYHVPGARYYDATVITTSKGERWFCTEAEAVSAGWRKAKV